MVTTVLTQRKNRVMARYQYILISVFIEQIFQSFCEIIPGNCVAYCFCGPGFIAWLVYLLCVYSYEKQAIIELEHFRAGAPFVDRPFHPFHAQIFHHFFKLPDILPTVYSLIAPIPLSGNYSHSSHLVFSDYFEQFSDPGGFWIQVFIIEFTRYQIPV